MGHDMKLQGDYYDNISFGKNGIVRYLLSKFEDTFNLMIETFQLIKNKYLFIASNRMGTYYLLLFFVT